MSCRLLSPALILVLLLLPAHASAQDDPSSWRMVEERSFTVDGEPVALSPDGVWIAGIGPGRETFCIWETESFEPTCDGLVRGVLMQSITWAPDSSAVAFSLNSPQFFTDSDLYVFDVASGTLENLTDDGDAELDLFGGSETPVNVDLYPGWSPDASQLVFARTIYADDIEDPGTTLMTIPREGGEPEELRALAPPYPMAVSSSIVWQEDDSILFSIWKVDTSDGQNGIWRTSLAGGLDLVLAGTADDDVRFPTIANVRADGAEASVTTFATGDQEFWTVPLDGDAPVATDDILGLDGDARVVSLPRYAPEGDLIVFLTRDDSDVVIASTTSGESQVLTTLDLAAPSPASVFYGMSWAENGTILYPDRSGGVLLTVEASS